MKENFTKLFAALAILLFALSCSTPTPAEKLDIKAFLAAGDEGAIYPTQAQLDMLKGIVPNETYIPMATIDERPYWDSLAMTAEGQKYLAAARELVVKEPEIPITDEVYRRANKEGNRAIYKPRYYRTMDCLEHFIIAECIENKGAFLDQIDVYSRAIMSMKSWLHPNHDDAQNSVLEGKRVSIDLGARKFGLVLALADVVLGDRLSEDLSAEIHRQLRYRITDSYLQSCTEDKPESNSWIRATSNWNSVCTSGSLFTIMLTSESVEERTIAMACAINSMKFYLSGFGEDGYCSEGTGYWNYGFGHYLYLAEIFLDYTDGLINLFEFDNPEKLRRVASFPRDFQVREGKFYAPFADGVTSVATDSDNFGYLLAAKYYGAEKPHYFKPDEAVSQVIGWGDAQNFVDTSGKIEPLPSVTYFDDFGIVISRGAAATPLTIAIKAGHNAENHNHSDVGSYYIVMGDETVAGDIGAPSYIAGAFDKDNPARSSWGHPVPRIAGTLQSNGIEFCGEVTSTDFSAEKDVAVLNILPAYQIEGLELLERTMTNTKAGKGQIKISDSFKSATPMEFGTAVMVNVDYKIQGNKIILNTGCHKVCVEVEATGGEFKIIDEWVPVEKLRTGRKSYRIGIDFTEPLTEGTISVKYTPIE